jgi:hypothetical protein
MSDGIGGMGLRAVEATLGLTDLTKPVLGLMLRDASIGWLGIGFERFGCLRDLVTNEFPRLLGGVSRQPHGFLGQEVAS